MTLKTEDALAAFHATLEAATGLPSVKRNDVSLEGFDESGTPGVRWKMAMVDDDWSVIAVELGDASPAYELAVPAQLILAVEGLPGPDRDAVFTAAAEALSAALFPGGDALIIAGKFEDLRVDDRIGRGHIMPEPAGRLPIETIELAVQLIITAPTPFG